MLTNKDLLKMYKLMLLTRETEKKLMELRQEGHYTSAMHTCEGQEAVGVGAIYGLKDSDIITTSHRGHAHYISKGVNLNQLYAEVLGKKTGINKGKSGHMLIADKNKGVLGGTAIVGGMFPLSVGYGMAIQNAGSDNIVMTFFGDGASNQGTFHEALNMASIWHLPCIYICENNQYALTVSSNKTINIEDISDRAKSYGIPGVTIDGNDVMAVHEVVSEAVKRARNGEGPTLIEAKTYRLSPFSSSDLGGYREETELKAYQEKDPLPRFEAQLIAAGIEKQTIDEIKVQVSNEIEKAAKFAIESDYPSEEDLYENIYM